MALIDFTEIPSAKSGEAGQDLWALFAREFFACMGVEVVEGPDRGPDSGRDLILVEKRIGTLGRGQHRWVVSCKHHAHSRKSVSDSEETDVIGRVRKFNANGFIVFYSTLPSAGLANTLKRVKDEFPVEVYDCERIERAIVGNPALKQVFERFFPKSFREYGKTSHTPHEISDSVVGLFCNVCGKDLLKGPHGTVEFAEQLTSDNKIHIVDMYWACKGTCNRTLQLAFEKRGFMTSWEDISDLIIPIVFMRWVIASMNGIRDGSDIFSDKAYEKFREFTFAVAQLVVRETSDEERERIESLRSIPAFLGGLEGWGPP